MRKIEGYKFKPLRQLEGVGDAVEELFKRKCAYCETLALKPEYVPDPYFLEERLGFDPDSGTSLGLRQRTDFIHRTHTPEHPRLMFAGYSGSYELNYFRPVSGVIGLDGKFTRPGYWWLAYDWKNVYLACMDCAKLKGNKFPVKGTRMRSPAGGPLRAEGALLLDPCADRPEEHLIFYETGLVASETEQGRTTIDVLGLNRSNLVKARTKVLEEIGWLRHELSLAQDDKDRSLPRLDEGFIYRDDLPHLALRRQFLQQWSAEAVAHRPDLESQLKEFLSFRTALNLAVEEKPAPAESSAKKLTKRAAKKPAGQTTKGTDVPAEKPMPEVLREKLEELARLRREGVIDERVRKDYTDSVLAGYLSFKSQQEGYSVERGTRAQKRAYHVQTRFIERVVIHNFKVIADLELAFPPLRTDEGSWLMLLGENGTGKSTILEAIALALMGDRARRAAKLGAQ